VKVQFAIIVYIDAGPEASFLIFLSEACMFYLLYKGLQGNTLPSMSALNCTFVRHTAVSTKVVPQKRKSVRDNADWYYG